MTDTLSGVYQVCLFRFLTPSLPPSLGAAADVDLSLLRQCVMLVLVNATPSSLPTWCSWLCCLGDPGPTLRNLRQSSGGSRFVAVARRFVVEGPRRRLRSRFVLAWGGGRLTSPEQTRHHHKTKGRVKWAEYSLTTWSSSHKMVDSLHYTKFLVAPQFRQFSQAVKWFDSPH